MSFTVMGGNVSPYVRKVRAFLAEKNLEYRLEPINPFSPPEGWRELSPLGKIPVLDHDGRLVNDSSVICSYVERIAPTPALYPSDPYECARALWFEEYIDGGFIPLAGPRVFVPLVLQPLMSGKEPDETEPLRVVAEKLPAFFDYLEAQVGDATYLVGGSFSIADIAVTSPFVNLRHAGVAPDARRWPRLSAFLGRIQSRPSFKALIEEETPIFGKRAALLDR